MTEQQPMAAAPIKYREDGEVDWANMWETFCDLALEGGPAHRGADASIPIQINANPQHPNYLQVYAELCRGIYEVSGLSAHIGENPEWLAIECPIVGQAQWLAGAINQEHVAAQATGQQLLVPIHQDFSLKSEIKSVITVVAKTTHYWTEHLPQSVKQSFAIQAQLSKAGQKIKRLFNRS
ncbi:MAG: hypothetical protein LCH85_00705 [Chloroflexi bacterium]|nr:hypothetical protein [Chloroflexota bacterium]